MSPEVPPPLPISTPGCRRSSQEKWLIKMYFDITLLPAHFLFFFLPDTLNIEPTPNRLLIRLTGWVRFSHFHSKRLVHTSHTRLIITPSVSRRWISMPVGTLTASAHRGAQAPSSARPGAAPILPYQTLHSFSFFFLPGWSLSWCQTYTPSCSCCRGSPRQGLRPTVPWPPAPTTTGRPWRCSQFLSSRAISSATRRLR